MSAPAETVLRRGTPNDSVEKTSVRVSLPDSDALANSANGGAREAAYFLVEDENGERQVRFKGDPHLWEWPGVYEMLVKRLLRGNAPAALVRLLDRALKSAGEPADGIRAIDLGAGNGWVARELAEIGVGQIVGVDPSPAAAAAAERDHPGIYSHYQVLDVRRLSESQRDELMGFDFNCLVHIDPLAVEEPAPNALTEAFNLLAPNGWVAFHLNAEMAEGGRDSRFGQLIHRMIQSRALQVHTQQRYRHRFTTNGVPVFHVAIIGRKLRDFEPGEPS